MRTARILILLLLTCCVDGFAQWTRHTNLPAVYVNTYNNVPVNSKDVYVYSILRYVNEADQVSTFDSTEIRGRGNSTWNLRKKPYKLKFYNKQRLLGADYAKAKKWTLLANAGDKTMMRNAITSVMGGMTSLKFNPAYKFVDMILNNTYMGTYQISDQVEVRAHRVNVVEQDYPLTENSDITGGYLLEVDGFKDGNCFTTSQYGVPVRIHYPDDEEIAPSQNTYIRNYIRDFEAVLSSADFDNPETGYRAWIDSLSLVDWYICTEVSANIDGFYSIYFYKNQQDPRLYWGPLWDYDIAYNNDYRVQSEKGISTTVNSLMCNISYGNAKMWVNRMWEDEWFARLVNKRYNELLDKGLVDRLNQSIDSLKTLLYESQQMNYSKWGINTRMYHEIVLYSTYDEYVEDLRKFISDRCTWLKTKFASMKPVEPTPPFVPINCYYRILNANTNKAIDLQNGKAVQWSVDEHRETEYWMIRDIGGGHFMIVNRSTNTALNDPTQGEVGPTVNVGTQLNTEEQDENSSSQLWNLLPQGTEGYYNLENVYTQHIANLSGGNSADGTSILSYTNDNRNATSKNRLWRIEATGIPLDNTGTDIEAVESADYALAYDPVLQRLHFGADSSTHLGFMVDVYQLNGRQVGRFRADETFNMGSLSTGFYVVTWTVDGRQRSVKFHKR